MITVLYGINPLTRTYLDTIGDQNTLIFASTNGGGEYEGQKVLCLAELCDVTREQIDKVIICSMHVSEITGSLLKSGFDISLLHFYDIRSNEICRCSDYVNQPIFEEDVLYAFYDLSCFAVGFDAIIFCSIAEIVRKELHKKYIHFIIVPNVSKESGYVSVQNMFQKSDVEWRLDHLLQSLFRSVENTISVTQLAVREEAHYYLGAGKDAFPKGYTPASRDWHMGWSTLKQYVDRGISLSCIKAPKQACDLVSHFLEDRSMGRKVVVITLRTSGVQAERNSNIEAWGGFLRQLDTTIYFPVIVSDTYSCTQVLPECLKPFDDFQAASMDPSVRIALHERAYINLCTSTGPGAVPFFMSGVRSIVFMPQIENNPLTAKDVYEVFRGGGGRAPFFKDNENQWMAWCEETAENITQNFIEMVDQIEGLKTGM